MEGCFERRCRCKRKQAQVQVEAQAQVQAQAQAQVQAQVHASAKGAVKPCTTFGIWYYGGEIAELRGGGGVIARGGEIK